MVSTIPAELSDKKQRRAVRHALQKEARKVASQNLWIVASPSKLKALAKVMTDRAIARGVLNP